MENTRVRCLVLFVLAFSSGCRSVGSTSGSTAEPTAGPTGGAREYSTRLTLRGLWYGWDEEAGTAILDLRAGGGAVGCGTGRIRVWVLPGVDCDTALDFDPAIDLPAGEPAYDARGRFPWTSEYGAQVSYDLALDSVCLLALIELKGRRFYSRAQLEDPAAYHPVFSYFLEIQEDGYASSQYQPDIDGQSGFKDSAAENDDDLVFDLAGQAEFVEFDSQGGVTHPFKKIWMWRRRAPIAGWPTPADSEKLHYYFDSDGVTTYTIPNEYEDQFLNNETNGLMEPSSEFYLYAIVGVKDGPGPLVYYQYKTTPGADLEAVLQTVESLTGQFRRNPVATGIFPK